VCACTTDFIDLHAATNYVILAGSTIANTGAFTTIIGDVGLTPGSAITALVRNHPITHLCCYCD
jgi:hypothetical protein